MFLKRNNRLAAASAYLLLITTLFFLPGSALPHENWFNIIYLDKWIHAGIFVLLSMMWMWALTLSRKGIFLLLFLQLVYGLGVEVVQGMFVSNRSFDLWDLLADMTGAVVGIIAWGRYIKK